MAESRLLSRLKNEFNSGSEFKRLIIINAVVFLGLVFLKVITSLFKIESIYNSVASQLILPGKFSEVIFKPWTMLTHMFTHLELAHFFWNMIMLFLIGRLFLSLFGGRRLIVTYLIGGLIGGLFHILSYQMFPLFEGVIIKGATGASGSVYAFIGAILYYKPKIEIRVYFTFKIPFWILASIILLGDVLGLVKPGNIAHFAHIGGALFGVLSVMNIQSSKQYMNRIIKFWENINWKNPFKKRTKFKVYKNEEYRKMNDDDYRHLKQDNQAKIDAILDKISKGGYSSLSKAEKDFLFKFGNDL